MLLKSIRKIFKVNILTQLIGLIIVPLLASNYSLEELGYYAFVFALSALLANFFIFRIENTFFSSSVDSIKKLLFSIMIISLLIFLAVILFLWGFDFDKKYIVAVYGAWLISVFNLIYCYNVRVGNETLYNMQKIIRVIFELLVVVICVRYSLDIKTCVVLVLSTYWVFLFNRITVFIDFKYYFYFIISKKDLIISDLISTSLFSTYNNSPALFLANIDIKLSGLYFVLYKFFLVPSLMIAQSLGTVIKQYASIEYESKNKISDTLDTLKKMFLKFKFFIFFIFFILIISFYILNYIYYDGLFIIFMIMLPCVVLRFFHLSYSSLVYVLSMQKSYLIFNLYLFSSTFLSGFLAVGNGYSYLLIYSICSSIGYILYAFYFFKNFRR